MRPLPEVGVFLVSTQKRPHILTRLMRPIVLSFAFAATTSPLAAQQAALTYLLGKDTSAIEQYTHQGNRIAGTMVQRAGAAVSVVRYEMTYGNDGRVTTARISRLQPDGSPLPNQPTETRFTVAADSIVREVVRPDSVQKSSFAARGATVAFPVYVYGPIEALAAARRRGAT